MEKFDWCKNLTVWSVLFEVGTCKPSGTGSGPVSPNFDWQLKLT